jgi:hypothetical protein
MKVERNDPCPCGSGKKYKKCCLGKGGTNKTNVKKTGGTIAISSYWVPTKESAEKTARIQIECTLDNPLHDLDNRTPYEDIVLNKSASNFFRVCKYIQKSPILKDYEKEMPLSHEEFSYNSVYSKTGGVLNLFNPEITESMDMELKKLLDGYDKKKAIGIWKETPSELWSNLPPKLVWAGGGKTEFELFNDFMEKLAELMEGREFETRGKAITKSLMFLRAWQMAPNTICSDANPADAIIEERQRIYKNKISFLKEMGIKTDFS